MKYRVFNNKTGKYELDVVVTQSGKVAKIVDDKLVYLNSDEYKVLLSIEISDKLGNELYVGDLVKVPNVINAEYDIAGVLILSNIGLDYQLVNKTKVGVVGDIRELADVEKVGDLENKSELNKDTSCKIEVIEG